MTCTIPSASHKKTNDKVLEIVKSLIKKDIKILDLGAGKGHLARRVNNLLLENNANSQYSIIAADISEQEFMAREVKFIELDFNEAIDLEPESFDIIYSVEVIEHLQNPYSFIRKCFELLKPGGTIILTTPNILNIESRTRQLVTGFPAIFEPPSIKPENRGRICGHIMPLNAAYYDYGLRASGFGSTKFFIDKSKKLSLYLYILLIPLIATIKFLEKKRIKRYDHELSKECQQILEVLYSRTILTSRSLIMTSRKAFSDQGKSESITSR
jgi:SAM-dependent methyltransferase